MTHLDDLVPTPLQAWTKETLNQLRANDVGETLFFEFKGTFDGRDVEKTVSAFANGQGGFLIQGATCGPSNRLERYPGIEPNDWPRLVGDYIVGHVSPLPAWDTVAIDSPDESDRLVVATRVEKSFRTPHILSKNGRIYIRTPAGSVPVSDKATLDSLVARGSAGSDLARSRADNLHQTRPGGRLLIDRVPDPWTLQIAAVPSPEIVDLGAASLVSESGYRAAGAIFTHPAVSGVRPKLLMETGVALVAGRQAISRSNDGSIFLREDFDGNYVGVKQITDRVAGVLQALSDQRPQVYQAFVDVRLLTGNPRRLDEDGSGASPTTEAINESLWSWSAEVQTHLESRQQVTEQLGRRLFRLVGDQRGFEPGS